MDKRQGATNRINWPILTDARVATMSTQAKAERIAEYARDHGVVAITRASGSVDLEMHWTDTRTNENGCDRITVNTMSECREWLGY